MRVLLDQDTLPGPSPLRPPEHIHSDIDPAMTCAIKKGWQCMCLRIIQAVCLRSDQAQDLQLVAGPSLAAALEVSASLRRLPLGGR